MESITNFLLDVFAAYIVTCVIVSSSLFAAVRERGRQMTPWLVLGEGRHPIDCRLCTGFWVSLVVCAVHQNLLDTFAVYGASYFLATQER